MPGVCPNEWQTYGCEWIPGYLWRWTNLLERLALLGLGLMLGHIVVVTIRVSYRYYSARHAEATDSASQAFQRNRRELVAVVSYNYLRTRIESLERELSGNAHERSVQSFQVAQKLPLTARFSKIPFAVIAAPSLAVSTMAFITFSSFHTPRGLHVGLASANCEYEGADRVVILRITDTGKFFLNTEREEWNSLPIRSSEIYRWRVNRTLYLLAEDGVPFQTVADALDILGTDKLNITVRLVTPGAMMAHCPEPVLTDSNHRAPR